MSTKNQNDQKIPPLLPLEYCTVKRAARLLGCEEEDIYHWDKIGAIRLHVYFDQDVTSTSNLHLRISDNRESTIYGENDQFYDWVNNGAAGELVPIIDNVGSISLRGEFGEFWWLTDEWEVHSKYSAVNTIYSCNARITGLWRLEHHYKQNDLLYLIPPFNSEMKMYNGIGLFVQANVSTTVWDGVHYLIKDDLQKLHAAIQEETPLPNRHNDCDIAHKMREQESQSDQVILMQELAKRVLGTDTIDMPSKQADALLAELSKSVPAEELPSARTVSRYLGGK
jgi:hypothetical protein